MTSIWQKNVDNLQSRNSSHLLSVCIEKELASIKLCWYRVVRSGEPKKGMRGINTSLTFILKTVNETHTEKLGRCDKWI